MTNEVKTKIQSLVEIVGKLCDKNKAIEALQAEVKELANIGSEILLSDGIPARGAFSSLIYDLEGAINETNYIDNDDILRYTEQAFTMAYDRACKACNGSGVIPDSNTQIADCDQCNGTGEIEPTNTCTVPAIIRETLEPVNIVSVKLNGREILTEPELKGLCPDCGGNGYANGNRNDVTRCKNCEGTGEVLLF